MKPAHSPLYIRGISQNRIIRDFSEVVLSGEYINGGSGDDSHLVQKWKRPIRYYIDPSARALAVLIINRFFRQLGEIEGFPRVQQVNDSSKANLHIYFLPKQEYMKKAGKAINYEDSDGIALFSFSNKTNEILRATIYYNSAMSTSVMRSVIREEIVNSIGLSNDTTRRWDSIIYQYSSENKKPSNIDWLIIKLLYSDKIKCGMNYSQCETAIKELYY